MIICLKTGERIDSREGQTDDREYRRNAEEAARSEARMLASIKELEEQAAMAF